MMQVLKFNFSMVTLNLNFEDEDWNMKNYKKLISLIEILSELKNTLDTAEF